MTGSSFLHSPAALSAAVERNPFGEIPTSARLVIVIYFVIWHIFPLLFDLVYAIFDFSIPYLFSVLTQILIHCLLLYPFLRKRFAGSLIGWVHPLTMPAVIGIALGILRTPEHLLAPFFSLLPEPAFNHTLLGSWPISAIRQAQWKANSITLLSVIATYVGFSFFKFRRTPNLQLPKLRQWVFGALFLLFVAIVLFFLEKQGGVLQHMTSLAGGRFRMRELIGHYLVLNNYLPYLLIFWYLYRPASLRRPTFIAAFIFVALLQFIVTGSRSGLFVPFAALLVAWILVNYRFPAVRGALLGLVAFVFLGALGQVRQSGQEGQVSFDALWNASVVEQWERTQEGLERQDLGTNLAVAAFVPTDVGYLWGRSYVAAAAFWVPRSIWLEKPRGVGAHTAALIYGGRSTMEGYQGAGYPISAPLEAYWNFSWPGVVIVFFIYGALMRFFADWREHRPDSPLAAMGLVLVIFQFSSPSTVEMVSFLQNGVLLLGTVILAKSTLGRS